MTLKQLPHAFVALHFLRPHRLVIPDLLTQELRTEPYNSTVSDARHLMIWGKDRPSKKDAELGPISGPVRGLERIKVDPEMVQLAAQLVERESGKYDSSDLEDRYETRLRAMIDAKLKGEGIDLSADATPEPSNVIDLMAALRLSR